MKWKAFLLGALMLSTMFVGGCGPKKIQSQYLNKTMYAQSNVRLNRGRLLGLNVQTGDMLPVGTAVTLLEMTTESATCQVVETGVQFTFMPSRHIGKAIEPAFLDYFGEEDPSAKLDALAPEAKERVLAGMPVDGMTKEEVLLAMGPPPSHRTPSRESNTWTYWRTNMASFEVHFENGVVVQKAAPVEPAEPEEAKEVMYARCNVHHRDGEVSWVNYQWGPVIPFNGKIEVLDKGRDSVEFLVVDSGMEIEFVNEEDKSGNATWRLFERLFSTEDQTSRLEGLSEGDKGKVLGGDVSVGMSKEAVEMSWCAPPPHRTPSTQSSKWIYWTNLVKNAVVKFGDDGKVKSVK